MKRILMMLMLVATCLMAEAQDLNFLRGQRKLAWKVDWTALTINRMDVKDWIEARDAEQPEYDAKRELENELKPTVIALVKAANKQLMKQGMYLVPSNEQTQYTVLLRAGEIDRRGNSAFMVVIRDNKTGRDAAEFTLNGKGGAFGSMGNLWADGMRSAGKRLGKFINKHI